MSSSLPSPQSTSPGQGEEDPVESIEQAMQNVEVNDETGGIKQEMAGAAEGGDRHQAEPTQNVGFRADMPTGENILPKGKDVLKCLTEVKKDTHDCYKTNYGVYEVPVSGKYKLFLKHTQVEEGEDDHGSIKLTVMYQHKEDEIWQTPSETPCSTLTTFYKTEKLRKISSEHSAEKQLEKGSLLFVEVNYAKEKSLVPTTYVEYNLL